MTERACRFVAALVLLLASVAPLSAAAMTTVASYDFTSRTPGADAFGYQGVAASQIPASAFSPTTPFDAAAYAASAADDASYHVVGTTLNQQWVQQRFEFRVDEDPASLTQLDVSWNGRGVNENNGRTDGVAVFVWNWTAGVWELLASSPDTEAEVTVSGNRVTGLIDYVGGASADVVMILVSAADRQTGVGMESRIETDHLELVLTSLVTSDHFAIVHDGAGVNCQAESVTIQVHDATHGLDTGYTGTLALSTSTGHGDWSLVTGLGTLTNSGNGSATYAFDAGDGGEVVLGLRDTFVETVDIDVSDGSASEDPSEDPPLAFAATGFEFVADGVASAIGTQIADKPSDVAPGAQSLELRAIRTSDATGACEAALQGPSPIELAFTCEDPSSCFGPQVIVNGASGIAGSPTPAPASWTSVSLDFGGPGDGSAPFTLRWADAGRIRLHARNLLTPSGEAMEGASNAFAVRPFAFRVAADGNPGASDGAGPVFRAAGVDFTGRVHAVGWQAGDDADLDGVADGHADLDPATGVDLTDNPALPAFGRDLAPETVTLASSLVAPTAGNDPGLSGGTVLGGFLGGAAFSLDVVFDEVGVIEIGAAVSDGDWLGIGAAETAKIAGRSGFVGRFRPSYFDVAEDTAPLWATACPAGGFTYLGQPFGYATAPVLGVTARSFLGTQTRNYTGAPPTGFFQLTNASLGIPAYASDPGAPAPLDTSGLPAPGSDPAILDLGDGTATLTFDAGSGLLFSKASPVSPFDADLSLSLSVIDADGVAWGSNPWRFGDATPGNGMAWSAGKAQRYGRLRLVGAFGSELSPLPEPLRAEYWTGTGFALHGDDGCTVVPAASVGTTARSPATLATTPSIGNTPLLSGDAGLVWSAPGQPGTADAIVNLGDTPLATPFGPLAGAALRWLRYDWTTDGAGLPIEDPTAQLTFGIFGGETGVIFRREVY